MAKKPTTLHPDAPLKHPDHPRPVTRRDFIRQGFMTGSAVTVGANLLNFILPREAQAISPAVEALVDQALCPTGFGGRGKIPFIAFDLAGGANIAGSNIPAGGQGGQLDSLDADGYVRQGLRNDQVPTTANTRADLGLVFHDESALFAGIMEKLSAGAIAGINGCVIPARSDNDTGNNPHNPMYGIAKAGTNGEGARGGLVTLIGSRASDSGGNSMAPASMIDPSIRPTKVDRPSDVVNMVDTGELIGVLNQADAVSVMESVALISNLRINGIDPKLTTTENDRIKALLNCGYVKAASITEEFGTSEQIDPLRDPDIVPVTNPVLTPKATPPIFTTDDMDDGEFRKTASVMKLVLDRARAGAGTITMGGYDYHTGNRTVGESRDLRAGRCIGACLEYAHRQQMPVMIYVFSDGSVFSNGMEDANANGKLVWTGDNSSTACSFFLVYNPTRRPILTAPSRQQLGYYRPNGAVETSATPFASNVNILVDLIIMNYMALHGQAGQFPILFPNHGLGADLDRYTAFTPIVNEFISAPV